MMMIIINDSSSSSYFKTGVRVRVTKCLSAFLLHTPLQSNQQVARFNHHHIEIIIKIIHSIIFIIKSITVIIIIIITILSSSLSSLFGEGTVSSKCYSGGVGPDPNWDVGSFKRGLLSQQPTEPARFKQARKVLRVRGGCYQNIEIPTWRQGHGHLVSKYIQPERFQWSKDRVQTLSQ